MLNTLINDLIEDCTEFHKIPKVPFVSFHLRNWNLTNEICYFFRMWPSTTFQSYHISLSQIHKVRDGN
jgi:hypothetical protein